jgi:hypothetical protein
MNVVPAVSVVRWVDDTAGLGRTRVDALLSMLTPFGCTVRADRGTAGMRAVHICGPEPVVGHLRERLGGLLADLDQAAQVAARRYGARLRTHDPDQVPDRRALTRQYRRAYLAAWAAAWAHRLSGLVRTDAPAPASAPAPVLGYDSAATMAAFDVAQLDPAPLRVAAAVIAAHDPSRHPAATLATVTPPVGSVHPDGPGRIAPGQRVTCLPGSLPAVTAGRGGGVLVSIARKTSVVDTYGCGRRRIPNHLLHPQAGPWIGGERDSKGLRTATASSQPARGNGTSGSALSDRYGPGPPRRGPGTPGGVPSRAPAPGTAVRGRGVGLDRPANPASRAGTTPGDWWATAYRRFAVAGQSGAVAGRAHLTPAALPVAPPTTLSAQHGWMITAWWCPAPSRTVGGPGGGGNPRAGTLIGQVEVRPMTEPTPAPGIDRAASGHRATHPTIGEAVR